MFQMCLVEADSRHDARQVEDLGRQVRHVAVEEDEQRLDDAGVRREAGREGPQEPVEGPNQNPPQSHHKETDHTEKRVGDSDGVFVRKLLKQMIQDLQRTKMKL